MYLQITVGLCLSGQLPWLRGVIFFPVQLIASLCAGGLVSAMFPVNIALANSVLGGGTSISQGLFMEMFFTSLLVFVVLMLAAEKSQDTFIAPIGIGLALFAAMIAGKPSRPQCRLWSHLLTMIASRDGLHGRITEPGAQSRMCCCCEIVSRISLDLLAWPNPGLAACHCNLSACQVRQL